jgi:hypothetical protein
MHRRAQQLFPFFVLACLLPSPVAAFVTLRRTPPDATAWRWSAANHAMINGAGLHDGIQVSVEPDFAEKLAQAVTGHIDPTDVTDIETALAAAFAAWESPVLRFTTMFDGPAQRGTAVGSEIDVFLVPEQDPVFTDNSYFGVTFTDATPVADRLLTNGVVSSGPAITGADIFLNSTVLAGAAPALTRDQQLAALQRLTMHEIGHALGFHHPNEFPDRNYDTDSDPLNAMLIDPDDPTVGLQPSSNVDPNSVVSNRPTLFEALFFTTLRHDERGGRDVLYPLHEPECPGDCDTNRFVRVHELIQSVNIALERAEVSDCGAGDRNRDARIRVDELVAAVHNSLAGCPLDRRIVSIATTSDLMTALPLATNRGTIRFEIVSTWEPDADIPLVALRTPQTVASRIQLVKNGAFLRFTAADARGFESEVAALVDQWAAGERHVITATWTRDAMALYLDGSLGGEQPLPGPIAHPLGAGLQVGGPSNGVALENLVVFGLP